jgi:hypothetical protein
MYEILRINLRRKHSLYYFVEECLDIDLGVADKFELKRQLSKNNHTCFLDLWFDAITHLSNMGYQSKELEKGLKELKKNEEFWAHVFSDRIRQLKKLI